MTLPDPHRPPGAIVIPKSAPVELEPLLAVE
jgi:hypothetical protein